MHCFCTRPLDPTSLLDKVRVTPHQVRVSTDLVLSLVHWCHMTTRKCSTIRPLLLVGLLLSGVYGPPIGEFWSPGRGCAASSGRLSTVSVCFTIKIEYQILMSNSNQLKISPRWNIQFFLVLSQFNRSDPVDTILSPASSVAVDIYTT